MIVRCDLAVVQEFADRGQSPLHVSIIVLPEASLMTFAATVDPIRAANRLGGSKYYQWRTISIDGQQIVTTSETAIQADGSIKDKTSQDVTVVLGSFNLGPSRGRRAWCLQTPHA